jgi:stringent starvation protein B
MRSSERPSKHEVFLALLREGWTSLHLDARRAGVIVPPHLRAEPHLVLQYGYDLPIPISDLEIDDDGVRATLSFSKNPQRTVIPWSAVYVVTCVDGRGVLYHEDVPEDVSIVATHPHSDRDPSADALQLPGEAAEADEALEAADALDVGQMGEMGEIGEMGVDGTGQMAGGRRSAPKRVPGSNGPSGRISERLLRSVPADGPDADLDQPQAARRRRKPQLRLVK